MKTKIMIFTLLVFCLGIGTAFAHKHKQTVKSALHELKEAKEILNGVTPDTAGHIAKANQLIDQASVELKAVVPAAKA